MSYTIKIPAVISTGPFRNKLAVGPEAYKAFLEELGKAVDRPVEYMEMGHGLHDDHKIVGTLVEVRESRLPWRPLPVISVRFGHNETARELYTDNILWHTLEVVTPDGVPAPDHVPAHD